MENKAMVNRAVSAHQNPARVYAKKGPVYDRSGNLICVLARDVLLGETNRAAHFAWPMVKDGDTMPLAIYRFVFDLGEWTQDPRHG